MPPCKSRDDIVTTRRGQARRERHRKPCRCRSRDLLFWWRGTCFHTDSSFVGKGESETDELERLLLNTTKRANSDAEPGTKTVRAPCHSHQYRLSRNANDKCKLIVFEEYDNEAALQAHQAADAYQAVEKRVSELASSFDIDFLHELHP